MLPCTTQLGIGTDRVRCRCRQLGLVHTCLGVGGDMVGLVCATLEVGRNTFDLSYCGLCKNTLACVAKWVQTCLGPGADAEVPKIARCVF